jgi:hypothetical protein
MMRATVLLLALLAPGAAPAAAPAGGFVDLSVGAAWREPDDDPPFDQLELEYDTGTVARLEVGSHYDSGLLVRVGYAYTVYDEFTALGSLVISEDIQQQEVRAGVFYATPRGTPLGWRLGGGYDYLDESSNGGGYYQRGGFVEAGAIVTLARVTLDFAAAFAKLGGPGDADAETTELRATAAYHARVMDFTLGARYAWVDPENFPLNEELLELRAGVAIPWPYRERPGD